MRPTFITAGGHIVVQNDNVLKAVLLNFDNNTQNWALNQDGASASSHSPSEMCYLAVDATGTTSTALQIDLDIPVKKGASIYSMGQGSMLFFDK